MVKKGFERSDEEKVSLYRPKGSRVWVMDFIVNGQRIRESTGQRAKSKAIKVHDKLRGSLQNLKIRQRLAIRYGAYIGKV